MAPSKSISSTPIVYTPPIDPDHEAKLKAEARAYALSTSTSTSKGSKRKSQAISQSATAKAVSPKIVIQKPTTLSIHRPDRPHKLHKANPRISLHPDTSRNASITASFSIFSDDDDDYDRFVKSLGLDDSLFAALDNDDEDFHLSDVEDEEDDDDDKHMSFGTPGKILIGSGRQKMLDSTPPLSSPLSSSPMALPDFDKEMYRDLEEELGSLLEEDMEAAVQSLMTSKKPTTSSPEASSTSKAPKPSTKKQSKESVESNGDSPATPLRETARQGTRAQVTYQQSQQLRHLLTRHYQLLMQQAILSVRAAQMQKNHKEKSDFLSGETADDLAEILDGAVGMLQDLDQNRKDAIRNSIQLAQTTTDDSKAPKGRRSLLPRFTESSNTQRKIEAHARPLTRSAFSKTLQEQAGNSARRTAFDIPGLTKLKETFSTIDKSVEGVKGSGNILESSSHSEACKVVLRQAGANIDETFIPGADDLSENFCEPKEVFGEHFMAPCSEDQQTVLRRNRNLFTSGEDNLVLRGVNLYGEKQWILIADRYLPDRSVNIISQRYSKLCVMLYKANNIQIDGKGNLEEPPKLESVDDIDEDRVKELELSTVEPPAILNVHRWSLEEDLTLLKAVPIMGHMWAELGARLIPHRDRGHLRKRYQVLERRVKATVARSSKADASALKGQRQHAVSRKLGVSTVAAKSAVVKSGMKSSSSRAPLKKTNSKKVSGATPKPPTMSIEKAAASLTFMRPSKTDKIQHIKSDPATRKPNEGAVVDSKFCKKAAPVRKRVGSGISSSAAQIRSCVSTSSSSKNHSRFPAMDLSMPGDPTSSRTAFERLVDGTSEEWSQMSRMKRMLENDAESQAADAIVSHLAKSPGPVLSMGRLPNLHLDSNSISGLSILQPDASKQAATKSDWSKKTPQNVGIMARVLESASNKNNGSELTSTATTTTEASKLAESPKKRLARSAMQAPPSTPKRTNFFSTSGTPIGLSPGFRPSPGTNRNSGSITLTPNVTYSPAPSTVMRLMSEPSGDEIRFCDFQISEESRKELEGDSEEQKHDPTPPPLTPSKNSLMLDDLEAISALNSLSNSPFRSGRRSEDDSSQRETKRSLFATVIGGLKPKDPKTRLQF